MSSTHGELAGVFYYAASFSLQHGGVSPEAGGAISADSGGLQRIPAACDLLCHTRQRLVVLVSQFCGPGWYRGEEKTSPRHFDVLFVSGAPPEVPPPEKELQVEGDAEVAPRTRKAAVCPPDTSADQDAGRRPPDHSADQDAGRKKRRAYASATALLGDDKPEVRAEAAKDLEQLKNADEVVPKEAVPSAKRTRVASGLPRKAAKPS
jgi:hypothetical protein